MPNYLCSHCMNHYSRMKQFRERFCPVVYLNFKLQIFVRWDFNSFFLKKWKTRTDGKNHKQMACVYASVFLWGVRISGLGSGFWCLRNPKFLSFMSSLEHRCNKGAKEEIKVVSCKTYLLCMFWLWLVCVVSSLDLIPPTCIADGKLQLDSGCTSLFF